jgi:hypothetical protein
MRKIVAVVAVFFVFLACYAPAPSQTERKKPSKVMTAKLLHSQKLLEGIAVGDFKMITLNADELIQLTKTEEWMMYKTPRYEMYSNEFRRAAETLIQKAKDKNIDGTTLAFFEMTMTCVRCHQHVREIRDARLPGAPFGGAGILVASAEPRRPQ